MVNGNIIFFGTSKICIPFLTALKDHFDIKLIITQPDAIGGRHRKKIIPPVKKFAIKNKIDFEQPEKLKNIALIEKIKKTDPTIGIVIAYGKLIPGRIFRIPKYQIINVHFSLLPLYRGAAPVQRAIENGDKKTGITIFEIEKKMDTGDIWAKKEFDIAESDTTESLWEKLSHEGSMFLIDTLKKILQKEIKKIPQNHHNATFAKQVLRSEGEIDWSLPAQRITNKFRAFTPWPGIYFYLNNKLIKIKKISPLNLTHDRSPGDIMELTRDGLRICCGENTVVEIQELQPEGKKPMTPYNFSLGNKIPDHLI